MVVTDILLAGYLTTTDLRRSGTRLTSAFRRPAYQVGSSTNRAGEQRTRRCASLSRSHARRAPEGWRTPCSFGSQDDVQQRYRPRPTSASATPLLRRCGGYRTRDAFRLPESGREVCGAGAGRGCLRRRCGLRQHHRGQARCGRDLQTQGSTAPRHSTRRQASRQPDGDDATRPRRADDDSQPDDGSTSSDGSTDATASDAQPDDGCDASDGSVSEVSAETGGCQPIGSVDHPDLAFVDDDCDGIDGTVSNAVFVSPRGLDSNAGTMESPKRTLAAAISAAAAANPRKDVYAAVGVYKEAVTLAAGVGLYGGYDDPRPVDARGRCERPLLPPSIAPAPRACPARD